VGRSRPWGAVELPDPSAPPADLPPWGPVRAVRAVRGRWRAWMAVPLVLAVVGAAALVPLEATVEQPGAVVDAATLVRVSDLRPAAPPPPAGTFLVPDVRRSTTALGWAVAALAPGRSPGPPAQVLSSQGTALLDVALLSGVGVAAGRGSPTALGLGAAVARDDVAVDQLGLLLHVADAVASLDLSGGRRVLVLGSVAGDAVTCTADPAATLAATRPPPDLVLVGTGCGADLPAGGVPVVEVPGFADALVALT
jgi:hypothetical protein